MLKAETTLLRDIIIRHIMLNIHLIKRCKTSSISFSFFDYKLVGWFLVDFCVCGFLLEILWCLYQLGDFLVAGSFCERVEKNKCVDFLSFFLLRKN